MSTAVSTVYGPAKTSLTSKQINWLSDEVKVSLHDQTYVPAINSDRYRSVSTASEVTGTGYVLGGKVLTGKTSVYNSTSKALTLSCDDITWANSTITASFALFYVNTGSAASSPLICWWDFGGLVTSSASAFTLSLSSSGLVTLT